MKSVYKYPIPHHGFVAMPAGSKILSLHTQHNLVCVWALVDPSKEIVARRFRIAGTGMPLDDSLVGDLAFVGTALLDAGHTVVHVFEETTSGKTHPDGYATATAGL